MRRPVDVVLDQHVVLEHGDLGPVAALADHHRPLDRLAAGEELGLGDDRRAATAGLAALAPALLLRLEAGRALDRAHVVVGVVRRAHVHHGVRRVVGRGHVRVGSSPDGGACGGGGGRRRPRRRTSRRRRRHRRRRRRRRSRRPRRPTPSESSSAVSPGRLVLLDRLLRRRRLRRLPAPSSVSSAAPASASGAVLGVAAGVGAASAASATALARRSAASTLNRSSSGAVSRTRLRPRPPRVLVLVGRPPSASAPVSASAFRLGAVGARPVGGRGRSPPARRRLRLLVRAGRAAAGSASPDSASAPSGARPRRRAGPGLRPVRPPPSASASSPGAGVARGGGRLEEHLRRLEDRRRDGWRRRRRR